MTRAELIEKIANYLDDAYAYGEATPREAALFVISAIEAAGFRIVPSEVAASLRSISLAEHLFDRHMRIARKRLDEAEAAAAKGDRTRQSIASTEAERHRFAALELRLVIDCFHTDDARKAPDYLLISRKLVEEARACMRETGWHLAPASEPFSADGVLECAVADIERRFEELLTASPVAAKEGE